MKTTRPFTPAFLKKFDDFLLKNMPEIWSTRAHLVIYYSFIFILSLGAVCYAIPDDARSNSSSLFWGLFLALVSLIVLVIWVIYVVRFNVFKRYGIISPVNTLATFLLYFTSIGFIIIFAYVPSVIESIKANQSYTAQELVTDMNSINTKICQIEYDSLEKEWTSDTVRVVDSIPEKNYRTYDDEIDIERIDTVISVIPYRKPFELIDTARLRSKLFTADSSQKVNDSIYVFYESPDYEFVSNYDVRYSTEVHFLSSADLYRKVVAHYVPPDKLKTKRELQALLDKYYYAGNEHRYYYRGYNRSFHDRVVEYYKLSIINDGFDNITDRKYRWSGNSATILWRTLFYITLVCSTLLFIFRHSTVKTFFLSLLVFVVLFIFTAIVISITDIFIDLPYYFAAASLAGCLFYFLLFTLLGAFVFKQNRRNVIMGIAINLWVLILPFIPLIIVSIYYAILERQRYLNGNLLRPTDYLINMQQNLLIAEIAGPIIFLALIVLYIHRLYRKWYALSEE